MELSSRIVNENGTWFVKGQGISVDGRPRFLAAGVDGAMWVGCFDTLSLQRIVNERGAWFVQGNAIPDAQAPFTMPDGSIWAFANDIILRQFWTNPAAPTDLKVVPGPHEGMATLSWKAPRGQRRHAGDVLHRHGPAGSDDQDRNQLGRYRVPVFRSRCQQGPGLLHRRRQ